VNDLPVLDATRLNLITRGNAGLAKEFLDDLVVEADELLLRLATLVSGDDRVAVSDVAHTLKGLATELGAQRLRAVAAALEIEATPTRWPEDLDRLNDALAELRQYVRDQNP
jgi:HPt (histidine-containing phosphotransfer) domain-containing protein